MIRRTHDSSIFILLFYYKGYKSEPAKWRDVKGKDWKGLKHKASVSSGPTPWQYCSVSLFRALTQLLWCPKFVLRFHSVGLIDWKIDHRIKFNLSLPFPPRKSDWYEGTQSPDPLVTWLVFLALASLHCEII